MAMIQNDWLTEISGEFRKPYYAQLFHFIKQEYSAHVVFPPADEIFNAFHFTPLSQVKVVILGQDPYHNVNQAHGLSFSVKPEQKNIPPSLQNIYQELHDDLGCYIPNNGYLKKWADQGVLLLKHRAYGARPSGKFPSGKGLGAVHGRGDRRSQPAGPPHCVHALGTPGTEQGSHAHQSEAFDPDGSPSESLLRLPRLLRLQHFSKANDFLKANGVEPIDWQIENIEQ